MIRLLIVVAALVCVPEISSAQADGHRCPHCQGNHRVHRQGSRVPPPRQPHPAELYGSFEGFYPGYGLLDPFAYDPYRYGSFKMQDPTDDPYLREKYRYHTFFPGRRYRRGRSRR